MEQGPEGGSASCWEGAVGACTQGWQWGKNWTWEGEQGCWDLPHPQPQTQPAFAVRWLLHVHLQRQLDPDSQLSSDNKTNHSTLTPRGSKRLIVHSTGVSAGSRAGGWSQRW